MYVCSIGKEICIDVYGWWCGGVGFWVIKWFGSEIKLISLYIHHWYLAYMENIRKTLYQKIFSFYRTMGKCVYQTKKT